MKTLIIVLTILSFLQSSVIPLNLVLIVLLCRSYLKTDKANLFLAFGVGLIDSHLNLTLLGLNSLIYLILVQITQVLSKSRLAGNSLMILPLSLVLLSVYRIALSLLLPQSLQLFPTVIWESVLSLLVFYLVRLWEERFIVRKDIHLKYET